MKRSIYWMLAAALLAAPSMAQTSATSEDVEGQKEKYEFVPHWTLGVQGGAAYTLGEADFSDLISPAVAAYGGYQFTPVVGLRVGASAWQAKGGWAAPHNIYKYNYVQGNVDVLFDLSALVCKYNPKRVFNLYAFVGGGVNYGFNNDEAVDLAAQGYDLRYLWSDHRFSPAGRAGLGVNLRLSDHVAFNIEGNANILSDHFNSKKAGNPDWQFNLMAGFTFRFGKTYKKVEPVLPPAPAPASKPEPQPAPKPEPKPEPKPQPVKKVEPMTQNIFFLIDQAKIRTSEQAKIDQLVAYMKQNAKTKVTLTGYADAATGSKAYNSRLSRLRAEAVSKALQQAGISADRITVDYKGDTVQPFDKVAENRVTICVAAE